MWTHGRKFKNGFGPSCKIQILIQILNTTEFKGVWIWGVASAEYGSRSQPMHLDMAPHFASKTPPLKIFGGVHIQHFGSCLFLFTTPRRICKCMNCWVPELFFNPLIYHVIILTNCTRSLGLGCLCKFSCTFYKLCRRYLHTKLYCKLYQFGRNCLSQTQTGCILSLN